MDICNFIIYIGEKLFHGKFYIIIDLAYFCKLVPGSAI